MPPISVVGIVWFRPEDYADALRIFVDADKLPATYEKWLDRAQKGFDELTRKGHRVERAYIDPKTFPDWCRARGLDIDAKARQRFAAEAVRPVQGNAD